jgi:hypothetical protein
MAVGGSAHVITTAAEATRRTRRTTTAISSWMLGGSTSTRRQFGPARDGPELDGRNYVGADRDVSKVKVTP